MTELNATKSLDLATLNKPSSPTIPTKLSTSIDGTSTSGSSDFTTIQSSTQCQNSVYVTCLQQDGYVVVPNLLPSHLLLATQATCKYLVQRSRAGGFWPHVRTIPKQYPPWPRFESPEQDSNIWGIQHLLHPDLTLLRDVFAEVYFSEEVLRVVRGLLADPVTEQAVSDDDLVMELFNLLISPGRKQGFELEWHRDDIRPDVGGEEEERLLSDKAPGGRQLHAQYNIALFEDESLIVVPGSHRRIRLEVERSAAEHAVLPNEVHVKLNPGDAVFYDSNILHRGVYTGIDEKEELGRMTLHGSVGLRGSGNERSRQVLQHGVGEWVEKEQAAFANIQDEEKKARAEKMREALIEMGKGRKDVGYSLVG